MLRVLLAFMMAVTATAFAMDNMHRVELGLVLGRAVHVRLFFLLLTSFLVGCFLALLVHLYIGAKSRKHTLTNLEEPQDAEEDDYFSD